MQGTCSVVGRLFGIKLRGTERAEMRNIFLAPMLSSVSHVVAPANALNSHVARRAWEPVLARRKQARGESAWRRIQTAFIGVDLTSF